MISFLSTVYESSELYLGKVIKCNRNRLNLLVYKVGIYLIIHSILFCVYITKPETTNHENRSPDFIKSIKLSTSSTVCIGIESMTNYSG
jgi:hypothetical protein